MLHFVYVAWLFFLSGTRRVIALCLRWLLVTMLTLNFACGAAMPAVESSVQAKHNFGVCTHDPDVDYATGWAYPDPNARAVPNSNIVDFNRAVLESGVAYHYDPFAPPRSVKVLPFRLSDLPCDRMHKLALEIDQLRPCSGDICTLLWPSQFSLPDDAGTCRLESTAANSAPVRGNLLGQAEGLPIRSTYFCDTMPVVPKNAPESILDKKGEIAWLQGYAYGYRVSLLLTQAEADIQAFINHTDPWIVRLFKKDPGSVDAIMQRVASALDAIPEPPSQAMPYLDHLAQDGYAMGARQGAVEVELTLALIETGAMIAEVALMEIALGPLGGANALRAALMRVRNIPIFIPGAVGGLGGFYRIGKAGQKIWSYSSEKLGIALIKAGKVRGAGQDAHHIVAGGHKWAEESRKILAKFGIKLDEAVNGVFLPATRESPNPLGSIVHRTLSNNKAYYDKVYEALKGLNSRDEVIAELRKIADALTNGTFL